MTDPFNNPGAGSRAVFTDLPIASAVYLLQSLLKSGAQKPVTLILNSDEYCLAHKELCEFLDSQAG